MFTEAVLCTMRYYQGLSITRDLRPPDNEAYGPWLEELTRWEMRPWIGLVPQDGRVIEDPVPPSGYQFRRRYIRDELIGGGCGGRGVLHAYVLPHCFILMQRNEYDAYLQDAGLNSITDLDPTAAAVLDMAIALVYDTRRQNLYKRYGSRCQPCGTPYPPDLRIDISERLALILAGKLENTCLKNYDRNCLFRLQTAITGLLTAGHKREFDLRNNGYDPDSEIQAVLNQIEYLNAPGPTLVSVEKIELSDSGPTIVSYSILSGTNTCEIPAHIPHGVGNTVREAVTQHVKRECGATKVVVTSECELINRLLLQRFVDSVKGQAKPGHGGEYVISNPSGEGPGSSLEYTGLPRGVVRALRSITEDDLLLMTQDAFQEKLVGLLDQYGTSWRSKLLGACSFYGRSATIKRLYDNPGVFFENLLEVGHEDAGAEVAADVEVVIE